MSLGKAAILTAQRYKAMVDRGLDWPYPNTPERRRALHRLWCRRFSDWEAEIVGTGSKLVRKPMKLETK